MSSEPHGADGDLDRYMTPAARLQKMLGRYASGGRLCPARAHYKRPDKARCSDTECRAGICARRLALGLDDMGRALPRRRRPLCGARTRAGGECRMRVVPGKRRCRLHGGLSTGARTAEGRARQLAALAAAREARRDR